VVRALRSVLLSSCITTMILWAGCEKDCPVMEVRHEVVYVPMSGQNPYAYSKCVEANDCTQLCADAASARSPYASAVQECRRISGNDGGVDGGSEGGVPQVGLEITYKV